MSVPLGLQSEDDLRQFLADLSQQAEKWNALKLVVLGHGEVGKTTLIHAAKQYLNASKFSQVHVRGERRREASLQNIMYSYFPGCEECQTAKPRDWT